MESDKHKPMFFNTIKWVIMISIVISIVWLLFAYVYADTYAKNKEARRIEDSQRKGFRTKFRVNEKTDPMAVLEPKKLANVIRGGAIACIVIQSLFLYGIYKNNRAFATAFIVWAFLCTVFAFKVAIREHLFWIQGIWCLSVSVATCFYVHFLFQVN